MRRYSILLCLLLGLVAVSRLPLAPQQLFSFDDINLVLGMGEFDPRLSQPQPPGYPLFILEMRVLRALGFKRPESNLIALAVVGSVASLLALIWCGGQVLGGYSGLYAALLLLFHPSFWYAGLTSALRVQLALVSAAVAGSCWRAWSGDRRWIFYSALALGLGSGIRPELGPLLVPLWIVGLVRARAGWRSRIAAVAILVATIVAWLLPTALNSGGWSAYWQNCWGYLSGQSTLTSPLFGLEPVRWGATIVWFAAWAFSGALLLPMLVVLAWGTGLRMLPKQAVFFVLWLAPGTLFALFVHVQDPGQTLAIVTAVCLLTAHQVTRAVSARESWRTPSWDLAFPLLVGALAVAAPVSRPGVYLFAAVALSLAAAVAVRIGPSAGLSQIGPIPAVGFALIPSLALFAFIFGSNGWYYPDPGRLSAGQIWSHASSGFAASGLAQIREISGTDDVSIRAIRRLAAERPGRTVVVSMRGPTSWRKVAYYLPELQVVVLDSQASGAPLARIATTWRGSRVAGQQQGPAPLRVPMPAGARLIWLTEPRSAFAASVRRTFPGTEAGPVYYHDLPASSATQQVGDFVLAW